MTLLSIRSLASLTVCSLPASRDRSKPIQIQCKLRPTDAACAGGSVSVTVAWLVRPHAPVSGKCSGSTVGLSMYRFLLPGYILRYESADGERSATVVSSRLWNTVPGCVNGSGLCVTNYYRQRRYSHRAKSRYAAHIAAVLTCGHEEVRQFQI